MEPAYDISPMNEEAQKKGERAGSPAITWRVRLLLVLLGVVASLLTVEIAFRIISPSLKENHEALDRPSFWYIPESSLDQRDYYYSPHKAPGVFRIIVVGDSFTYAGKAQFDDSFSKRLERMLNLNTNQPKVEVLNWGVPGYSTVQEAWMVKKALSRYQPDLIILQVTLNDPEIRPYRVTHPYQKANGQIESTVLPHWKSLNYIVTRILNSMSYGDYEKYYFDLFNDNATWSRFAGAIKHIVGMTSQAKVPLIVVVFPLFSHPINDHYVFKPLHEKIDSLLSGLNAKWLDLSDSYKGIPPIRLQAIPGEDSHPNEIAHRIAADAIYQKLAELKLVPDAAKIKNFTLRGRTLSQPLPKVRTGDEPQQLSKAKSK